ncbi:hypothetical protein EJB05_34870, partial [Eragrostis curvula]
MEGLRDAEVVKAIACREGLALASDLGARVFRMATDCANVVRSILGKGMGMYGPIILEFEARRESFTKVEVVHERR